MELFGFEITRKKEDQQKETQAKSFVPKRDEDTTSVASVAGGGGHFGHYVDIDGTSATSDAELIRRYREIALHPECDAAIEDVVNEAVVSDNQGASVDISLDDLEYSDKIKNAIRDEWWNVLSLLRFNRNGHDIFRRWYVDGRIAYHNIIDNENPKKGLQELRYIDPVHLRKVKEVEHTKDPKTGAELVKQGEEFYVYSESNSPTPTSSTTTSTQGIKIHKDAITYVTSGIYDQSRRRSISHLHKAIKPVNQLRMMEDSLVIYRLSRAPERRIFYIDVGNLPKGKAEQYLQSIMNQYRNKMVYDAKTGEMKDDQKHMSMLEDFWLPRREGGRGTEISTLPGGENLGQIDDIVYFQKRLYKSLNVPASRLEQETQFNLGRASEISREELKFQKFVDRLRKRFSLLLLDILKTQLLLKNIISENDWDDIAESITVDFIKDSAFSELKETEIMRERLDMLSQIEPYVGSYFSKEYVMKNVLQYTEEQIKDVKKQIDAEIKSGDIQNPEEAGF